MASGWCCPEAMGEHVELGASQSWRIPSRDLLLQLLRDHEHPSCYTSLVPPALQGPATVLASHTPVETTRQIQGCFLDVKKHSHGQSPSLITTM